MGPALGSLPGYPTDGCSRSMAAPLRPSPFIPLKTSLNMKRRKKDSEERLSKINNKIHRAVVPLDRTGPGGTRRNQEEPGGTRRNQEEPGGTRWAQVNAPMGLNAPSSP
ncbi:hypothetical protein EYF80_029281 [Liparis tanakae]|uniref:Uncharacterized protein n=1 Tax=Liparis tanakae TaxID=230148 RepID=A0A4Z2H4P4_9TELE|nr:hypothetical protein EYF80_029281 [Liparis tanakae]